jgi:hypothetical protein
MKTLPAVLLMSLVAGLPSPAAETPKGDFKPFFDAVKKLVERHYPKADVTVEDAGIRFTFNARKFMIHEARKDGEWQDATEEVGPQKGGICGEIEVEPGAYDGQAFLPQDVDKHYYTEWLAAPYSKRLDRHLLVHLKHPSNAPKDFLKDFTELVEGFEKRVP